MGKLKIKAERISDVPTTVRRRLGGYRGCTIGADPEFFIANKHGKITAGNDYFPDKYHPLVLRNGERIFYDGIPVEINPVQNICRETVLGSIHSCLRKVERKLKDSNGRIIIKSAVKVQREVIDNAAPDARVFGCDPDVNAYTRRLNVCEIDASRHLYRYAGGHIHIGRHDPERKVGAEEKLLTEPECHIESIKFLDMIVGTMLLLLDNSSGSKRRKILYGKAGNFRANDHGLEYRTPTNVWLKSPLFSSLIFGMVKVSWALLLNGTYKEITRRTEIEEDEVRETLDNSDAVKAMDIWSRLRPYLAVTSCSFLNPVNRKPVRHIHDRNGMRTGETISGLMLFEYLLKIGGNSILGSLSKEWGLSDEWLSHNNNGFITSMLARIESSKKTREDFTKFRKSFEKEAYNG